MFDICVKLKNHEMISCVQVDRYHATSVKTGDTSGFVQVRDYEDLYSCFKNPNDEEALTKILFEDKKPPCNAVKARECWRRLASQKAKEEKEVQCLHQR